MKKRKWMIPVAIVGIVAIVIFVLGKQAGSVVIVPGTEKITKGTLEASVTANGTMVAKELRDMYVETPVKVLEILVDSDEPVKEGETVIEVDMRDLNSQLEQAKLNRDSQELNLIRVRDINSTQSLSSLELSVKQAQTVLASDKETLRRTQEDYDTNKKLHDSGAISDSEFDRYTRSLEDAKNRIKLSEISLSTASANLVNNKNNNTKSDDQRELDIATQENMLKLQELSLKNIEDKIARIESAVKSPIDGVITVMNAVKGVNLNVAQPAYRVSDMETLEVKAEVKEVEARYMKLDQMVQITGDGIDENLSVIGKVTHIASTATVVRNSTGDETVVGITITVENPPEGLRPGLTVTARIITNTRENTVIIRYAMLVETEDGQPAVYVDNNGIAKLVPIELGITADLDIEVIKGLSGEETLIVNPPQNLKDGMKFRMLPERMQR